MQSIVEQTFQQFALDDSEDDFEDDSLTGECISTSDSITNGITILQAEKQTNSQ